MTWADFVLRGSSLRATVVDDEAADAEAARAAASAKPVGAPSLVWRAVLRRSHILSLGPTGRPIAFGAVAALTLGLTAGAVLIGAASPIVDRPALFVTLRAVLCLGLLLVAVVMGARGAGGRMAGQLLATAAAFAVSGLTAADAQLPFVIGRVAVSVGLLLVMYLCFSYPTGRIEDVPARRLIAASASVIGALLAANLLLSNVPPVAGPFVRCTGSACPSNPLNAVALTTGPSRTLSSGLALVTAAALLATAVMLARRAVLATPLQRRSVAPLMAWASAAAISYGFFVTVRALDESARLLSPAAVIVAAIITALPLALALAMTRGRVFAMSAVERLIADLEAASSLARLQQTMARAFRDPQLQLLLWDAAERQYVDVAGHPVDLSTAGPARGVAVVGHGGERLAVIVHDPVVPADVIDAAGSAIRLALDNARLQVTLSASIRALEASRKRVARAADQERRRIERDLHDGAQQGLIAVRIRLQFLEDVARKDPQAVAPALADAGRRVQAALDEIRDLAHGIYPSALSDLGLAYALADVARAVPVQVALHADLPRRVSPEVETAVYFCCVEALQNVAKHCRTDTKAEVSVFEARDGLHFAVTDAGPGFDPALIAGSHGITGMHDRLEAVGGRLSIRSGRGRGCRVSGHVPLRA
jgi:signal transduction histidine kinase